jgi:hypothetical protein
VDGQGHGSPVFFEGSMSKQRITHDAAVACATKLTEDLRGLVMDSEVHDLWELLVETVKAAIEAAFAMHDREFRRLHPSAN